MESSLIRIGNMEDFLEWMYKQNKNNSIQVNYPENITDTSHLKSAFYSFQKNKSNPVSQVSVYQLDETGDSLSSSIEYLTSTLGEFPRIIWILISNTFHDCGCRKEWCIKCEKHGGPHPEIQRAASAYLFSLGGYEKSNLKMLNLAAGKYPHDHPHMDDICSVSLDLMMYKHNEATIWLKYVCKCLVKSLYCPIEAYRDTQKSHLETHMNYSTENELLNTETLPLL